MVSLLGLQLHTTVRLSLGLTYQKITPLLFKVPLSAVEDQACVYGDLTASGIAGGLAGEYAGRLCLKVLFQYNISHRSCSYIPVTILAI